MSDDRRDGGGHDTERAKYARRLADGAMMEDLFEVPEAERVFTKKRPAPGEPEPPGEAQPEKDGREK